MAENSKESSMEEILSSIKRIIAEDKAIEIDRPIKARNSDAPKAKHDEILELTEKVEDSDIASAQGVFGDRRTQERLNTEQESAPEQAQAREIQAKEDRLIDDQKLDSMRNSLSALVAMEGANSPAPEKTNRQTSLEDMTRELMKPMLKSWLDENLPGLVEEMVAREIQRISSK